MKTVFPLKHGLGKYRTADVRTDTVIQHRNKIYQVHKRHKVTKTVDAKNTN